MGAWGTGPFENDDAMDFVGDLSDAPASETDRLLRSALAAAVDTDDYLEAPQACTAIAAAAIVAAATGAYETNSEAVADLVVNRRIDASDELRELAEQALTRVAGTDSELRETWEDSESKDTVLAELQTMREALV
ncbi:MAG: DUF4259 domain-containing protein [Actinomycetota bacterium]|nr:DUF4259 domain-containing protein [Actinomycetota bacterium]